MSNLHGLIPSPRLEFENLMFENTKISSLQNEGDESGHEPLASRGGHDALVGGEVVFFGGGLGGCCCSFYFVVGGLL